MSDGSGFSVGGKQLSAAQGGLLFLVIGLGASGFGAYDYVQQSDAVNEAVEVDATVVETGVDSVRGGSSPGVDYKPEVTFEYEYDGETYTGNNVFPATISRNYDTRSAAASVLEGYDEGETVTAYVNPDSPGDAFLKDEKSNSPLLFVGIGGLFAVVGGSSLFKSVRSGR
ncbi:DUF3592 domain-containing protein [Halorussus amylolyticus]|uniref:DUF3592 domain-containing protein n=1 Tax=Halorussus amylolyticus TaxID=1126242 RepID=UPI001048C6CB|nr:DUF3592 domain-containing protein [Halorussus amylolyticus]